MKKTKVLFTVLTAAVTMMLLVLLMTVGASAETYSGTAGENITWTLDTETGVLNIEGTGYMWQWSSASEVPWYDQQSSIETVVIEEGINSIGNYAFSDCSNLIYVTLPDSINYIPSYAFYNCNRLTDITIPDNVTKLEWCAFSGCSGLKSITIPDNVSVIDDYAFSDCSSLTGIIVPDTVTYIGYSAFSGCSSLESIILPFTGQSRDGTSDPHFDKKHFRYIFGANSFSSSDNCVPDSLKTVVITDITSVVSYAFYGCNGIESIVIPEDVTSIGNHAFYDCSGLKSVFIPESVSSIGEFAFYNCHSLTGITIPEGVTSIGQYTFYKCSGLTSVTIPDSVTSIGLSAFSCCSGLMNITIPNSVASIGSSAFYGCSGLTSIIVPDSVTSIGYAAFQGCNNLSSITLPFVGSSLNETRDVHFGYVFGASSYSDNSIRVPSSLRTVVITGGESIGNRAFYNCSSLVSVSIPDSVTNIGSYSFYNCSGMTSIIIPDGVTSIGKHAFYRCSGLTSVTIPFVGATKGGTNDTHFGYIFGASSYESNADYVPSALETVVITGGESIGSYAFSGCIGLTSITIPESVMSIGKYAFYECVALEEIYFNATAMNNCSYVFSYAGQEGEGIRVVIGANVTKIPGGLFEPFQSWEAPKVVSVEFEEGSACEIIGSSAFSECINLTSITIPNSVTSIDSYAFSGCSGLTNVIIPNSVTNIGNAAFQECDKLSSIIIPDGVMSIGYQAFADCRSLTNIVIPEGVVSIGGSTFERCYSLTNAVIPESVTSIGSSAFYGCSSLTSINIPEGVTRIGNYAFAFCSSLTSIVIPDSVTSIEYNAFYDCSSLMSITIPFVGATKDGTDNTHFGYIFGASSYSENANFVPASLQTVVITGGERIENFAFYNCSSLVSISIPDSVTSIGLSAFEGCNSLMSITIPFVGETKDGSGNTHFGYIFGASSYSENANFVPASLQTVVITGGERIENFAFYNCSSLVSISIPDSVTSIGLSAFEGCNVLMSITIPFVGETKDGSGNTHFGYIFGASSYYENANFVPASLQTTVITGGERIKPRAFYGCSSLTSISIPNSVSSIGYYAFCGCSSLTSMFIPEGVTSIDASAFQNCSSLTSITIPDSVTSIGTAVFSGCSSLTSITIPEGVTKIDNAVFLNCSSLTNITIPSSVTSIGSSAFEGCSSLTNITVPNGVTSIGAEAFYNCSSLTSITIPESVTSIGNSAFYNCDNLISVIIPENSQLVSIGSGAFSKCSGLTSITIPESVTSIGDEAFYNCSSLTSITIPESVTEIGNSAFSNCNNLTNVIILENSQLVSIGSGAFRECSGLTSIAIPDGVTSIGDEAFYNCSSLTSITIPEGVTIINRCTFYNCSNLTSVTILEGVMGIDFEAFYNCSSLTSINVPDSVTAIGLLAFSRCSNLMSIILSDNITYIGSDAFSYCSSLTSITIPEGVTKIDNAVFLNCSSLTNITIPSSVTSIGSSAFEGCSSLTNITIPNGVTSIGNEAFYNCSSLTSITIPAGVTEIDGRTFYNCNSMTSITVPNSVTRIGYYAFYGCNSLVSMIGFENVSCIEEYAFYNCSSLTGVINFKGVSRIGQYAFYECSGQINIKLLDGVTRIGSYTFCGSGLTSIAIPDSVTNIDECAFRGCSSLTSIEIPSSVTSIGSSAFEGCSSLTSINIPDGVTTIYPSTFSRCRSLTSVTIPNSVTNIWHYAFQACDSLKSITIPDSVTSIGDSVFRECSSLTSIMFPDGLTSIGYFNFGGCSSLTSIIIPEGVTSIVTNAFYNCYSLTSIIIPEGVTSIGSNAFYNCYSLTSIIIPEGVTSIGSDAFYNCDSLTSIIIPEGVTSIGSLAFHSCSSLASISIPASVMSIGDRAFSYCSDLVSISVEKENTEFHVAGNCLIQTKEKVLIAGCMNSVIPDDGSVTSIGDSAFAGRRGLVSIAIPESVTSIGEYVFCDCDSLTTIVLPFIGATRDGTDNTHFGYIFGASYDGKNAAYVPASLKTVVITGRGRIEKYAFWGCNGIETIIFAGTDLYMLNEDSFDGLNRTAIFGYNSESDISSFIPSQLSYTQINEFGQAGESSYWMTYCQKNGSGYILTVFGYGQIDNGTIGLENKGSVVGLIIKDGITAIGVDTFAGFPNIASIRVGGDVENVCAGSFNIGDSLKHIFFLGDAPSLDPNAIQASKDCLIHFDANKDQWTRYGSRYQVYIPGAGLSTTGDIGYQLIPFENLNIIDDRRMDDIGLVYSDPDAYGFVMVVDYQLNDERLVVPQFVLDGVDIRKVTGIGTYAIENSSNLKQVILPATITSVYPFATNCPKLQYIYFYGDRPIVQGPFSFYFSTDAIVIVDKNSKNWGTVFCGATVYTSTVLNGNYDDQNIYYTPDITNSTAIVGQKTTVENNAVNSSKATAADIIIPDFVTYNGIPYKVIGFDRYAFYGNKQVETITFGAFIGEGETATNPAIWDCTFRNTPRLIGIYVNEDANNPMPHYTDIAGVLYGHMIVYNPNYEYTGDASVTMKGNNGEDIVVGDEEAKVFPSRLIKYPEGKTNATFTIPDNVTVIERYAFAANPYLTQLDLNDVNVIGSHAFYNVTGLTTLIDNGYQIQYLEDSAFENTRITNFKFRESLNGIGGRAFYGTRLSSDIKFYKNIAYIGEQAFGRCTDITSFGFVDGNLENDARTYIVDKNYGMLIAIANDGNTLLQFPASNQSQDKRIVLNMTDESFGNMTVISPEAFYGAKYLKEVILNDNTKYVGTRAFANCGNLTYVKLGKGYFGSEEQQEGSYTNDALYSYNLFEGCTALTFIEVSPDNLHFCNDNNGVLYSKDLSTLYCYPAGLTRVSYRVFPETVKIYDFAFAENTNIKQIVMATTERMTIGSMAFSGCSNLLEIYYTSPYVPVVHEKIYDQLPNSFVSKYKDMDLCHEWKSTKVLGNRSTAAYSVIEEVPNDKVNTNEYTLVIRDTSNKPIPNARVTVTVYEKLTGSMSKLTLTTDENGLAVFSTWNGGDKEEFVHLFIKADNYFDYDFDIVLDGDMMISYVTLSKMPDVQGNYVEMFMPDQTSAALFDTQNQTVEFNMAQFREEYVLSTSADDTGVLKYDYGFIDVAVFGYWDVTSFDPVFELWQDNTLLATSEDDANASFGETSGAYIFRVSVGRFKPETPVKAVIRVTNQGGRTGSCEKILNIHVIDFSIREEDIQIDTSDMAIDFNSDPSAALIGSLLGKLTPMEFELGKKFTANINVEGTTATVEVSFNHSAENMPSGNDYKKGYESNHGAHNKNTYFYQFYDGTFTYNIRFARGTEKSDYYYYRVYVYHKDYDNAIVEAQFGGVNALVLSSSAKGREKVRMNATLIYQYTKKWIEHTIEEKKKNEEEWDDKNPTKLSGYEPIRESFRQQSNTVYDTAFKIGASATLTFEYRPGVGLELVDGVLKGQVTFTASASTQTFIWIIPVTAEISVELDGTITLHWKFDEGAGIVPTEAMLELKAEIEARVGIGCNVASVGFYGKLGTIFALDLKQFEIEYWEIHGEFGWYYKVLWYEKSGRIWPKEGESNNYYIIDNRGKNQLESGDGNGGPYFGARSAYALMFLTENYAYDVDGSDKHESIRIIEINGTLYRFSLMSVSEWDGYDEWNATKLVYSVWDGEAWSEPAILDDCRVGGKGVMDGAYALYQNGNELYLVYTQQSRVLTEAELMGTDSTYVTAAGLTLKCMNLSNGVDNATAVPVVDGLTQTHYKYLQQVAVVNGVPTIAWAQNADNNVFGVSPYNYLDEEKNTIFTYDTSANSVWIARYENDGWTVECLADGLSAVTDLAIGNDGSIYFVIDENSDLSDPSDSVLYRINDSMTKPIAVAMDAGKVALTVEAYGDELICYVMNGNGFELMYLTADDLDAEVELPENADMLQTDYFAVTDKSGDIVALLYSRVKSWNDELSSCSVIWGMFRTDTGWGSPVVVYDPDRENCYVSSFDAALTADGKLLVSMSLNDKNSQALGDYTTIYDMNAENLDINYEINYRDKTVTFTVTNNGAKPATVSCTYYGQSGILKSIEIASGETASFTVSLTRNATLTLKTENQTLNSYEISLDYTDLQVMGKQIVIGENNMLLLAIKNLGNMEARDILIKVYQGIDEGATLLTTFPIEKLDGNDMLYFEMVLDTLILRNGSDILTVVVESGSWDEYDDNDTMITYLSEITQGIGGVMDPVLSQYKIQYFRGQSENVRIRVICAKGDVVKLSYTYELWNEETQQNETVTVILEQGTDYEIEYADESNHEIFDIVLKTEYLNSLAKGRHVFKLSFSSGKDGEEVYDTSTEIEINIAPKTHTVTWVYDKDNPVPENIYKWYTSVEDGKMPVFNDTPAMDDMVFVGWSLDGTEIVDLDDLIVTSDMTLYAVFESVTSGEFFTVIWDFGNGVTQIMQYPIDNDGNETVNTFEPPCIAFNGMKILGWDKDGDGRNDSLNCESEAITVTYRALYYSIEGAKVTVEGNAVSGQSLKATVSDLDIGEGVTVSYIFQWYRDDEPIDGATNATYYLTTADVDHIVWVRVMGGTNLVGEISSEGVKVEPNGYYITVNSPKEYSVTIDGEAEYFISEIQGRILLGTEVTLTVYDLDNFAYWKDQNNKIVSRTASHTFIVTGQDVFTAVYNTKITGKVTVIYESYYSQIIARTQLNVRGAQNWETPDTPTRFGYACTGWSLEGDALVKAIENALATETTEDDVIVITPVYVLPSDACTVTVENGIGSGVYLLGKFVTAFANQPAEDEKFAYWIDETGTVLSYRPDYSFFATEDTVITAVFVAEDIVIDPIGLTRMLSITKDHENGKIIFVSWAVVPENCKILKAGVIVTTNQSVAESGDGFNADSALRVGTGTTEDGQLRFTYSLKTSKVVYARTYLVYSDENGEMITIYGDVIRTSLAEE